MTPYRERREQGFYAKDGKTVPSTTSKQLGGLGAAQHEPKPKGNTK